MRCAYRLLRARLLGRRSGSDTLVLMILDHIDRAVAAGYRGLSANFAAAFDYLVRTDFSKVSDGRHEVKGEDVFALVQSNELKPIEACRWEAHETYADIQLVLAGEEEMGCGDRRWFEVAEAYDAGKDVGFYDFKGEHHAEAGGAGWHLLFAGDFAVFMPSDVHMPLVRPEGVVGATSRKVVMKVRVTGAR